MYNVHLKRPGLKCVGNKLDSEKTPPPPSLGFYGIPLLLLSKMSKVWAFTFCKIRNTIRKKKIRQLTPNLKVQYCPARKGQYKLISKPHLLATLSNCASFSVNLRDQALRIAKNVLTYDKNIRCKCLLPILSKLKSLKGV
jgi:hypothetical protein